MNSDHLNGARFASASKRKFPSEFSASINRSFVELDPRLHSLLTEFGLEFLRNKRVIDIGCGWSLFAFQCAMFGAKEVCGVDSNLSQIRQNSKVTSRLSRDGVRLKFSSHDRKRRVTNESTIPSRTPFGLTIAAGLVMVETDQQRLKTSHPCISYPDDQFLKNSRKLRLSPGGAVHVCGLLPHACKVHRVPLVTSPSNVLGVVNPLFPSNLTFRECDILKCDLSELGQWDLVSCLLTVDDTIERESEEVVLDFFERLVSLVEPGGFLVLQSANRIAYSRLKKNISLDSIRRPSNWVSFLLKKFQSLEVAAALSVPSRDSSASHTAVQPRLLVFRKVQ